MLSIFSKKHYLKDYLEGLVDIHCHILPGIDDGAKTVEESIEIIQLLHAIGISKSIPTPHVMEGFYPNTKERIQGSYKLLLEGLDKKNIKNNIINPSAEYMIDSNFENLVNTNNLLPLFRKYILIEMSYFKPSINLHNIIFDLQNLGYIPILAHPERYNYFHDNLDYYKELKSRGCLFQLNLLSLSNHYGEKTKKTAYKLIQENLIDFTATDAHNSNHVKKISEIKIGKSIQKNVSAIITNTREKFSIV